MEENFTGQAKNPIRKMAVLNFIIRILPQQ